MTQNRHWDLLLVIVSLFFAVELFMDIFNSGGTIRIVLMLKAFLQTALLLMGYWLLIKKFPTNPQAFLIPKNHGIIFLLLFIWVVFSILAGLIGVWQYHFESFSTFSYEYILGDMYKFLILPAMFVLFYFAIDSLVKIEVVVKLLVYWGVLFYAVYLTAVVVGLIILGSGLFIPMHMILLPALFYAFFNESGKTRWFAFIALLGSYVFSALSRSIFVMLNAAAVPFLFFILHSRKPIRATLLASAIGTGIIMGVFSTPTPILEKVVEATANISPRIEAGGMGAIQKIKYVRENEETLSFPAKVEYFAGGRITEWFSIWAEMTERPWRFLTGYGMGSTVTTRQVFSEYPESGGTVRHTLHSAFAEVLFRTGLIGLFILIFFLGLMVKKGRALQDIHPIGILGLVVALQTLGGWTMGATLASGYAMICLAFASLLFIEKKNGIERENTQV